MKVNDAEQKWCPFIQITETPDRGLIQVHR